MKKLKKQKRKRIRKNSKVDSNYNNQKCKSDNSDKKLINLINFTYDIVDKQYRSYVWNDGKIQALVTIDTALIAGLLLIFQSNWKIANLFFVITLLLSFLFLVISFIICLVHAIPKIHSGIGQSDNLRTMVGISQIDKYKYHKEMLRVDLTEILRMNCWQISGMCRNNLRSHKLIWYGALNTIIGVTLFFIITPSIYYNNLSVNESKNIQQENQKKIISKSVEVGIERGIEKIYNSITNNNSKFKIKLNPEIKQQNSKIITSSDNKRCKEIINNSKKKEKNNANKQKSPFHK